MLFIIQCFAASLSSSKVPMYIEVYCVYYLNSHRKENFLRKINVYEYKTYAEEENKNKKLLHVKQLEFRNGSI